MIEFPQHLKAKYPLPDNWMWRDESRAHWASLRPIAEVYNAFFVIGRKNKKKQISVEPMLVDECLFFPTLDEAMSYVYNQFVFNGPTTTE